MQVPRINPLSRLSVEYRDALGPVNNFIRRVDGNEAPRTILLARNALRRTPIKKYEEHFAVGYDEVVTPENIGAVDRLNALVGEINAYVPSMPDLPTKAREECTTLKSLVERIDNLIQYGIR